MLWLTTWPVARLPFSTVLVCVFHSHQIQTTRWGGLIALGAGGVGEETGEPFFGFAATGDVHEAADDEADHFVEEAVAGEFELDEVA